MPDTTDHQPSGTLLEMNTVGTVTPTDDGKFYGEPRKFDPTFKGPVKNRSCTDILCLFIFIFFLIGWAIVAFFAFKYGDPERLIFPTDSQGNICGRTPVEDRKHLFFFDIKKCLERAYKPGDILPAFICNTPQVCVETCPNSTFSVGLYTSLEPRPVSEDVVRQKLICQYGVDPMDKSRSLDDLVRNELCADYYITSGSVAGRCLPAVKLGQDLYDEVSNKPLGTFSGDDIKKRTKVLAGISSAKDVGELVFQDFKSSWPYILGGLVVAMLVAFIWILLMRWIAGIMIWLSILCLIVVFSFGTYYCFSMYVQLRSTPDTELKPNYEISLSFRENLRTYSANKKTWLILGIVSVTLLVILLLTLIFLRARIIIAIALIKEASKAVALMPSALFFPLLPYLLHVLVLAFWGSVAVYLASSGKADYRLRDAESRNITTTVCPKPEFNGTLASVGESAKNLRCQFTQYVVNEHLSRAQIYNFIGLIWGMFFVVGLGQVALAAAFASYYWAFRKPQDVPFFAVLNGICLTLRYHLGSVAFGSLILTIVRCIRLVLEYIDAKLKKYDNQCTKCLLWCCKCCFWCLEKFIKFLNKNAYIMIAIYGKNFCASAKDAFMLLMRNAVRVVVLDKVTDLLLLIGKLVIVGTITIMCFYIFNRRVDAFNQHLPELNYYLVPVITISAGAYVIASSFFSVYGMAVDTLFLCFLEDCERNDGSEEKPYFMSKELMKILGKKNKFQDVK
ncbi:choline transporter-like protein 4 isoform X2 [Ornithodoros turicata]|uniref:choline transporter-like protein 4 isoform X2 n=1 Tax=Ornithodoros turicata TaxID=34597 RepID=UPI003138F52A